MFTQNTTLNNEKTDNVMAGPFNGMTDKDTKIILDGDPDKPTMEKQLNIKEILDGYISTDTEKLVQFESLDKSTPKLFETESLDKSTPKLFEAESLHLDKLISDDVTCGLGLNENIIDVGDLPDGIIDVGDLPDGLTATEIPGFHDFYQSYEIA